MRCHPTNEFLLCVAIILQDYELLGRLRSEHGGLSTVALSGSAADALLGKRLRES